MNQEDVNNLVARGNAAMGRDWKPIATAPKDGTHFLAWGVLIAEETDDDRPGWSKPVREENAHIAYWVFDDFAEFPFRTGTYGKPQNLTFTHWMPLPAGPQK
jgi:hypothetical protein